MDHHTTSLNVALITPEEVFFSSTAHMAVMPGVEGDIGVLYGHSPLITMLRPGPVRIYESDTKVDKEVFVAGGFAEITGDRCVILAEDAIALANMSVSDAEDRYKDAQKRQEANPSAINAHALVVAEALVQYMRGK